MTTTRWEVRPGDCLANCPTDPMPRRWTLMEAMHLAGRCPGRSPLQGHECTRPPGHTGRHMAAAGRTIIACW